MPVIDTWFPCSVGLSFGDNPCTLPMQMGSKIKNLFCFVLFLELKTASLPWVKLHPIVEIFISLRNLSDDRAGHRDAALSVGISRSRW
jgi:hypothetical protein